MDDSFKNFYNEIPHKDMRKKYKDFEHIRIEIPFRMCVIGSSGSGKTNFVINFIHKLNCFTKIYLFCKCPQEPLYMLLRKKMERLEKKRKEKLFFQSDSLNDFPSFGKDEKDKFDNSEQNLVIIDDLMLEKNEGARNVSSSFIFGRKHNVSIIYICQSYFKIDPLIRKNMSILALKKINTHNDLINILKEISGICDFNIKELEQIYKASQKDFCSTLLIDLNNEDPKLRIRINFDPIIRKEKMGFNIEKI